MSHVAFKGLKMRMLIPFTGDKKQLGAARRSMYYLVHGNPNREGQRGHKGEALASVLRFQL